ncbi:hypothetical protein IJD34_06160 [bacterium]|nr:hypothetical protein [bacterium]
MKLTYNLINYYGIYEKDGKYYATNYCSNTETTFKQILVSYVIVAFYFPEVGLLDEIDSQGYQATIFDNLYYKDGKYWTWCEATQAYEEVKVVD